MPRSFNIPIFNGRTIVLTVPQNEPLTQRDWRHFLDVLDALRPALVEPPSKKPDLYTVETSNGEKFQIPVDPE